MGFNQNENWISNKDKSIIELLLFSTIDKEGITMELGCWQGQTSVILANDIYPEILYCIDHWEGNIEEEKFTGETHYTTEQIKLRDVYKEFIDNMNSLTNKNYIVFKDTHEHYLSTFKGNIKFAFVDGSHDYQSVKNTILLLLPHIIEKGVIIFDDYHSSDTTKLDGGVKKAVHEFFDNKVYCDTIYTGNNIAWVIIDRPFKLENLINKS